jgi:hypothetical protein
MPSNGIVVHKKHKYFGVLQSSGAIVFNRLWRLEPREPFLESGQRNHLNRNGVRILPSPGNGGQVWHTDIQPDNIDRDDNAEELRL